MSHFELLQSGGWAIAVLWLLYCAKAEVKERNKEIERRWKGETNGGKDDPQKS